MAYAMNPLEHFATFVRDSKGAMNLAVRPYELFQRQYHLYHQSDVVTKACKYFLDHLPSVLEDQAPKLLGKAMDVQLVQGSLDLVTFIQKCQKEGRPVPYLCIALALPYVSRAPGNSSVATEAGPSSTTTTQTPASVVEYTLPLSDLYDNVDLLDMIKTLQLSFMSDRSVPPPQPLIYLLLL